MVFGKNRTVKADNFCPKCGRTGERIEFDPNTGTISVVCSNKSCRSLLARGWF